MKLFRIIATKVILISTFVFISPNAFSADAIVIKDSTPYTANISSVGNIWTGNIPKTIEFPLGNYSQKIEFQIQGLLPIAVLTDRATGTDVEFELWSNAGKKIAYDTVYSSEWNPVGPNTLVSMYLSESDAIGSHTMIVRTIYELKTNGLLTSYLKKEDRFPVSVIAKKKSQTISVATLRDRTLNEGSFTLYSSDARSSEYSLKVTVESLTPTVCEPNGDLIKLVGSGVCTLQFSQNGNDTIAAATPVQTSFKVSGSRPSAITNLSANFSGQNLNYNFSKPTTSNPITKYEVTIQNLKYVGLPVSQYVSYGPYTVIKTIYSEQFSLSSDEIKNYLLSSNVQDVTKTSIMVRVIAYSDLGASDFSNGIYTETYRFNWSTAQTAKKVTITCVKGKLSKKITGTNPSCPAGYTKK